MTFGMEHLAELVSRFYWPFVRVAALFSIAPVIGNPMIPVRIRVIAACLVTLAIISFTGEMPDVDPLSLEGVLVTARELIVGLSMGLLLLFVFGVFTMAGESIAGTMGLGFALMSDPRSGFQVPVLSQFFNIMATLMFLALNGHHALFEMLVTSFQLLPVGVGLGAGSYREVALAGGFIFKGAVMVALPALITMLSLNLVMGVMTRSAPQLNIFSVGFPITMFFGFLVILVTLPNFVSSTESLMEYAFSRMIVVFELAASR
jgi:flagellar biosynthetic protein FliR